MSDLLDLRERVIWVVNDAVGASHKYQYLETRTGISARKWKNMCNRVQQPSIEMIAALATEFRPEYLEWMIHGTVIANKQTDPRHKKDGDGQLSYPSLSGKERASPEDLDPQAAEELTNAFFELLEKRQKKTLKK
jgi:hypothetical protein